MSDGLVVELRGRERHVGRVLVKVLRAQAHLGETLAEVVAGQFNHDALNLAWLKAALENLAGDAEDAVRVLGLALHQAETEREREDAKRADMTRVPFDDADDFNPTAA
jgi:hypothetical protein